MQGVRHVSELVEGCQAGFPLAREKDKGGCCHQGCSMSLWIKL